MKKILVLIYTCVLFMGQVFASSSPSIPNGVTYGFKGEKYCVTNNSDKTVIVKVYYTNDRTASSVFYLNPKGTECKDKTKKSGKETKTIEKVTIADEIVYPK